MTTSKAYINLKHNFVFRLGETIRSLQGHVLLGLTRTNTSL